MAASVTGENISPLFTVATLPAAADNKGMTALVSDATATPITGLGLAVVGSGANTVKVWSNGTAWLIG
jgi:hypothetical protein